MSGRRRSIAKCSMCKTPLQAISVQPDVSDDLYCMSLSLMPDIVKIGRSKNPTQRALELQTSAPYWVFPAIVWVRRGDDEGKVHEALRPYRLEHAPSREYFRVNLKRGSDIVEQVIHRDDRNATCETSAAQDRGEETTQAHCKRRKQLVMCATCLRIQATVSDVQIDPVAEHLFLVTAPFCSGMVGVLRSSDPHKHVQEIETDLPGQLEMQTIWYGKGSMHGEVQRRLSSFRADCPGGEWFHMNPQPASAVISRLLFGSDEEAEPGIVMEELNE